MTESVPASRTPLEKANVLLVGTIRDGGSSVVRNLKRLRRAFSRAASLRSLVVESDSSDDTLSRLQSYFSEQRWGSVLGLGRLRDKIFERTCRIAYCRNIYLDAIRSDPAYSNLDYVVVADLDGVNRHLTPTAVGTCWTLTVDWDVVTANQLGKYYDVWALRHPVWSPDDCWHAYEQLRAVTSEREALQLAVKSRYIAIKESAPVIQTESSFGCLAIYKRSILFSDAQYRGFDESGRPVCEHVPLHHDLCRSGAKIYINPAFINRIRVRGFQSALRLVKAALA